MPIMTHGGQKKEHMDTALVLLQQGDMHLESEDAASAIECYIKAADLVPDLPDDYALKAGNLVLSTNVISPQFERQRVAACFFDMVSKKHPEYLSANHSAAKAYRMIRSFWRLYNFVPLPHIVFPGEGGMIVLVELVWNNETPPPAKLEERPELLEKAKEYACQGHIYGLGINTMMDDDLFEHGEDFDLFWRVSPPMKSDGVLEWLRYNSTGMVSYISPGIRPVFDTYLDSRIIPRSKIEYRWKATPPSMTWYRNMSCWKHELATE